MPSGSTNILCYTEKSATNPVLEYILKTSVLKGSGSGGGEGGGRREQVRGMFLLQSYIQRPTDHVFIDIKIQLISECCLYPA
jgi:hypothetical protein